MAEKGALASKLSHRWQEIQTGARPPAKCFIGFDGFTDEISRAVAKRTSLEEYKPFPLIADFGKRIMDAAGESCNIELVVEMKKLGGNAPIMTNAMLSGGHEITFVGPIGLPGKIEPIFQEMAEGCEKVIALGPSAHSDAIEFEDGKVILGKHDALKSINYHTLLAHLDKDELLQTLDTTNLFVSANWTMLPMMNDLWAHLLKEIVPRFSHDTPRFLFVDLADPAKRSDEDIQQALELLKELNKSFHVVLGLNHAEAARILKVLGIRIKEFDAESVAETIQEKAGLHMIVVHSARAAFAALSGKTFQEKTFYTDKPKITTGAGDNFNAGFCTALLYGLSPDECLLSGIATSGYYIRQAKSPTIPELAAFLHERSEVA